MLTTLSEEVPWAPPLVAGRVHEFLNLIESRSLKEKSPFVGGCFGK